MKNRVPIASLQFLGILCLVAAFSACKNQNDPLTKTDLLSQGTWKMSVYTINPGVPQYDESYNIIGYNTDMLSIMGDCARDDTYKFEANKVIKFDEGALKCDATSPQTGTGSWSFNADETVLTMVVEKTPVDYTIIELTADVMKLRCTETDQDYTVTSNITYVH
jgi:hypothetical protein